MASKESGTPNYAKDMIGYITTNKSRSKRLVNNEINKDDDITLPRVYHDDGLLRPSSCGDRVSCDLLYDLDWRYRLRAELSCSEAVDRDPCFATNACLCNNGYFAVSAAMPMEVPSDYSGDSAMFKKY